MKHLTKHLTANEIIQAKLLVIRCSQQESYSKELQALQKGTPMPKGSEVKGLNPFIDDQGIMRVGGRLGNPDLPYSQKHTIIIQRKSWYTRPLVRDTHFFNNHCGATTVLSLLSYEYFIKGVKRIAKDLTRTCVPCQRRYAVAAGQMMGELPATRTEFTYPFQQVGLDYAEPVNYKGRGIQKSYICLYVCMQTRAIHLELVSDMTATSFLNAFERFIARRGIPTDVFSDNGSNFIGAEAVLNEIYPMLQEEDSQGKLNVYASQGVPRAAPPILKWSGQEMGVVRVWLLRCIC